ncbi:hypothetical protein J2852_006239 [Azospirillum soli]|nr:hypothetical protein [Azospirillum soli]
MQPTIIGLDLAKSVFQVHAVDDHGKVVLAKRLRRDGGLSFFATLPACVVGMEACASAHHWARALARLGHTVRLMPPQYVKPYITRHARGSLHAIQPPHRRTRAWLVRVLRRTNGGGQGVQDRVVENGIGRGARQALCYGRDVTEHAPITDDEAHERLVKLADELSVDAGLCENQRS